MKTLRRFLPLIALLAVFAVSPIACTSQQTLDPAGAYAGDYVLWTADTIIVDVSDLCDTVKGIAQRNPAVFAASPSLTALLARVEKEKDGNWQSDEVLAQLLAARDAYKAFGGAQAAATLQDKVKLARAFLAEARPLLLSFIK